MGALCRLRCFFQQQQQWLLAGELFQQRLLACQLLQQQQWLHAGELFQQWCRLLRACFFFEQWLVLWLFFFEQWLVSWFLFFEQWLLAGELFEQRLLACQLLQQRLVLTSSFKAARFHQRIANRDRATNIERSPLFIFRPRSFE
jgi:hypothetical protein